MGHPALASGSGLEDGAEDGAVLGVVGVGSGGGDEEGRDAERGVADGEIDDMHACDGGDVPGEQIVGIAPGDDLRFGGCGGALLEVDLALALPVGDGGGCGGCVLGGRG